MPRRQRRQQQHDLHEPPAAPDAADDGRRHELYQAAVQWPAGECHWLSKFFRRYVGGRAPTHLREDFCGTALLAATWCRQAACNTATGVDLDLPTLAWAAAHNLDGCRGRLALLCGDVLQPPGAGQLVQPPEPPAGAGCTEAAEQPEDSSLADLVHKPADIICAFNFSVCMLHKREQVLAYFRLAFAGLAESGGILVADLMGGHSVEAAGTVERTNFATGLSYSFEQERWNPLTRMLRAHITLCDPRTKRRLPRAFTYDWRLWSVRDLAELMGEAGFRVAVWVRPLASAKARPARSAASSSSSSSASTSDSSDGDEASGDEEPFLEFNSASAPRELLDRLARGWAAYVVGVRAAAGPAAHGGSG